MAGLEDFKVKQSAVQKELASDNTDFTESSEVTVQPEPSTGKVFKDAFSQYNVVPAAVRLFSQPAHEINPGWDFDEHKSELVEGVDEKFHTELAGADSLEHAKQVKQELLEEQERLDTIHKSGITGAGASIAAMVISPDMLIAGSQVPKMLKTGDRIRKFMKLSAEGAAYGAVPEAVLAGANYDTTGEDVFYAGLFGAGIVGGIGVGGDIMHGISKQSGDVLKRTREEMEAHTAARNASAAETVDRTRFTVSDSVDDIMQGADEWEMSVGKREQWKVAETIDKVAAKFPQVFKTDSTNLWNTKSSVARKFTYDTAESGSGIYARSDTAAQIKDVTERKYLSKIMLNYENHVKAYKNELGIRSKGRDEVAEQFNRDLRLELEGRRRAFINGEAPDSRSAKVVQEAADEWQSMMDDILEDSKRSGVYGFDSVDRIPGYVPLQWAGDKLARLSQRDYRAYKQLLIRAYEDTGIPEDVADKIAGAVFDRAGRKDMQLDSNIRGLFSGDSGSYLKSVIGEEVYEQVKATIAGKVDDQGKTARARKRTDLDMSVTDNAGRSLLDIVNNDMQFVGSKYAQEMAGRVALAQKGIDGDGAFQRIKEAAIRQAGEAGDDVEAVSEQMDSIYNQLLSRPATGDGINRTARRFMDFAGVSMLGGMGMAQLAEYGPVLAQVGVREAMKELRILNPKYFKREVSDDLLSDLESVMGPIGQEEYLYSPYVRLEDKADAINNKFLSKLDKVSARATHINGVVSLQFGIKRHQQRIAVVAGTNRLVKAIRDGRDVRELAEEIGTSKKTLDYIKKSIEDGRVEFSKDSVAKLNLESWPREIRDNFAVSMNRHMNQVVQRTLAGETSAWMDTTLGKLMMQFRNYPVAAMGKQLMRGVRRGPAEATGLFLYSTALATLAYNAKNTLQGKDVSDRTQADHIRGVMQMSSPAGLLPNMYESTMAIFGQDAGLGGRGVEVSNPVISVIESTAKLPKASYDVLTGEATRDDVNTISALTPYSSVIGVANFFNKAREEVDD